MDAPEEHREGVVCSSQRLGNLAHQSRLSPNLAQRFRLHITSLEALGIAGVFVATSEFKSAAVAQGTALGFEPTRVLSPTRFKTETKS